MDKVTYTQDNHEKLTVTLTKDQAIEVIKAHTKWRKGDMLQRFSKLGSKEYDEIIKKMHNKFA